MSTVVVEEVVVVVEEVVKDATPVIVEKAGEFIVANAGTLGALGVAGRN
jgi:hypothetical protein